MRMHGLATSMVFMVPECKSIASLCSPEQARCVGISKAHQATVESGPDICAVHPEREAEAGLRPLSAKQFSANSIIKQAVCAGQPGTKKPIKQLLGADLYVKISLGER